MRENEVNARVARQRTGIEKAQRGARRIERKLDHRRRQLEAEGFEAARRRRMNEDRRGALVEHLEKRRQPRISEVPTFGVRRQSDAVQLELRERAFDLGEARREV